MLGVHHAGTGLAAWVAFTASSPFIPSFGVMPLEPAAVALGGVVAAGAALLPDADHPSATISYSVPVVGKAVTSAIGSASGGHRHGTHSGLSAILVVMVAFTLTPLLHGHAIAGSPQVFIAGAVAAALLTFAMKVLRIVRSWGIAWLTGIIIAGLITLFLPGQWEWLPWAVAIGWVTHMAGDFLTVGGLPLLWPLPVRPPKTWKDFPLLNALWTQGGYFALPIVGVTGSWRESVVAVPLTLYGFYGIGVSALSLLPFLHLG